MDQDQTKLPIKQKATPKTWLLRFLLVVLGAILVGAIVLGWPLRGLLKDPLDFFKPHLVIFFNEAEARPCGGFVTAFGRFRAFPPQYEIHNAYHFKDQGFGDAPAPLNKVASQLNFWDLGMDEDPEKCQEVFQQAYESTFKQKVARTWLINFSVVENVFNLVAPVEIEGVTYEKTNFFSTLSQSVSDIDRHSEISLQNRKNPLNKIGKTIVKRLLTNPINLWRASRVVDESLQSGDLYLSGLSPRPDPGSDQFRVVEWNLGGGKSSRFLKKTLKIRLKQQPNTTWSGTAIVEFEHLGGFDQPISQVYKGMIDVTFPKALGGQEERLEVILLPGEFYRKEYTIKNKILKDHLSFFVPRGQHLSVDMALSAFPQQIFANVEPEASTKENVLVYEENILYPGKKVQWSLIEDKKSPFITLHKPTRSNAIAPSARAALREASNFLVELHFNELVRLDGAFTAALKDTNYEKQNTDHPKFLTSYLMDDQRTLLLGFNAKTVQKDERFTLSIKGVRDMWGNRLERVDSWTIIPR